MLPLLPLLLSAAPLGDAVLIKAGTIRSGQAGEIIRDGSMLLVDGKIARVGANLEAPPGVRVVDYGADAVIVPGLIAADSSYGQGDAADRAAAPMLRASDNFNPWTRYTTALAGGVTAVYLAPSDERLIAGQGGVAKTAGDDPAGMILSTNACLHGNLGQRARNTPGYWEPPLPATVDQGLGVAQRQLPKTTMGAIAGLEELLDFAAGNGRHATEWGAAAGPALAEWMLAGRPWRMGVEDARQAQALLEFFKSRGLPLVLEVSAGAAGIAADLAAAGVAVVFEPGAERASGSGSNFFPLGQGFGGLPPGFGSASGQGDARFIGGAEDWSTASRLVEAGVRVVIAPPDHASPADLLSIVAMARRGGLSADAALAAITTNAAEVLGVADRIGSLAVGKDADFVVLNGSVGEAGTGVLATWIDGELRWKHSDGSARVIRVEELHLGNGEVLSPGEILFQGRRIVEVGRRVARPAGAVVVSGFAAMPGAIDAWGQLGLEGSRKGLSPNMDLARIVEPPSRDDLLVAARGVTTVNLGAQALGHGAPSMAYKPAAEPDAAVLAWPTGMFLEWDNPIPSLVGQQVQQSLGQAAEYTQRWREYEEAMAKWTPPVEEDKAEVKEAKAEEEKPAEETSEEKKKKPKEKPAAIVSTGTWEAEGVRLRILEEGSSLNAQLRWHGLLDLVQLSGTRNEHELVLDGMVGLVAVRLAVSEEFEENDVQKPRLEGSLTIGAEEAISLKLLRTTEDYPIARKQERKRPEAAKEPKGKPKSPGENPALEPLRRALLGSAPVFVHIAGRDQIEGCLAAFNRYGLRPVLVGNPGLGSEHAGRVAGVMMTSVGGAVPAGVPIMFRSNGEQIAGELLDRVAAAVAEGMSPGLAVRALTGDAARMLHIDQRVGLIAPGRDADIVLFDGPPLYPQSQVLRVWVNGEEIEE